MEMPTPPLPNHDIYIAIDPTAGGPASNYVLVSFQHSNENVTVVGTEVAPGCIEPNGQHLLVEEHIAKLRETPDRAGSRVVLLVKRNLGFEAEHHQRALSHIPNTVFQCDVEAGRVGILATESVQHAATELFDTMLQEKRLTVLSHTRSESSEEPLTRLLEQDEIVSTLRLGIYASIKFIAQTLASDA